MESEQRSLARLRSLAALGIEVYAARRPLTGAAPSRVFAIPMSVVSPTSQPTVSPRHQPGARGLREVAPPGESIGASHSQGQPATGSVAAGDRFYCRLAVWTWQNRALIVADVDGFVDNRARMQALARLVGDVHRSVGEPGDVQPAQFSRFDWPVADAPRVDSSLRRAAEVFGGYVRQRLADHAAAAVIVLGDVPASLLAAAVERTELQVPIVNGPSPRVLFAESERKRELWSSLQGLRGVERS